MSRPRAGALVLGALLMIFVSACSNTDGSSDLPPREDLRARYALSPYGYEDLDYPPGNRPTDAGYAARVRLGRLLFFDPILSGDRDTACASCHHPAFAWGDGRDLSIGVSGEGLGPDRVITDPDILTTPRNAPTCLNTALNSAEPGGPPSWKGLMFWDGRAHGLEDQALQPTASFDEMRHVAYASSTAAWAVVHRVRAIPAYVDSFRAAFPLRAAAMDDAPTDTTAHVVQRGTLQQALAAYQRELVNLDSPYDRYVAGDDYALSDAQFRGLDLFFGKALCGRCHGGPALSDFEFSRTGVRHHGPGRYPAERGGHGDDRGIEEHTQVGGDIYKFKTPGLRNVELTGPWFRNGTAKSLEATVWFYALAGQVPASPTPAQQEAIDLYDERFVFDHPELLDPRMEAVALSAEEVADIVAFLCALTDTSFQSPYADPTVPESVPSGLPVVADLPPFSMTPRLAAGAR